MHELILEYVNNNSPGNRFDYYRTILRVIEIPLRSMKLSHKLVYDKWF